eukprot:1156299-Pelagomonas_calceolata.AAC.14
MAGGSILDPQTLWHKGTLASDLPHIPLRLACKQFNQTTASLICINACKGLPELLSRVLGGGCIRAAGVVLRRTCGCCQDDAQHRAVHVLQLRQLQPARTSTVSASLEAQRCMEVQARCASSVQMQGEVQAVCKHRVRCNMPTPREKKRRGNSCRHRAGDKMPSLLSIEQPNACR